MMINKLSSSMSCLLHTCSTSSPVPSRATAAASSSRRALGRGSTKLRWKDSYKFFSRSYDMRLMFASVGDTKYTAGTSGSAGREECSCLCRSQRGCQCMLLERTREESPQRHGGLVHGGQSLICPSCTDRGSVPSISRDPAELLVSQ